MSSACVCELPDIAWHDPALLFRGQRPSQLSRQKNPGKRVTNKLAARKGTRSSKSQAATGAESSNALLSVLSSGSLASFGGASLVALIVEQPVPRQLASAETSRLAYEGNFKETEKELAKNSFRTVSPELVLEQLPVTNPVPRLNSNSLIQFADLSFQLQSLQQTELVAAYPVVASLSSRPKSLHQKELEATYSAKKSLTAFTEQLCFKTPHQPGPTRVRELELLTAQLCKQDFAENSLTAFTDQLCFMAQFPEESLQQKELAAAYVFKAQYQHAPDEGPRA